MYSAHSLVLSVVISDQSILAAYPPCVNITGSFLLISGDEVSLSLLKADPATSAPDSTCSHLLWNCGPFVSPLSLHHLQPLPSFDLFVSPTFFQPIKFSLKL